MRTTIFSLLATAIVITFIGQEEAHAESVVADVAAEAKAVVKATEKAEAVKEAVETVTETAKTVANEDKVNGAEKKTEIETEVKKETETPKKEASKIVEESKKAVSEDSKDSESQEELVEEGMPSKDQILADGSDQMAIGDVGAPVAVIEYFSLSCPHCAHFYEKELPLLKEKYIDTGKVRLLMRHFPHNAPAVKAAQLVKCLPKERQHEFTKVLLKMQDSWAFTANYEQDLKKIAEVGGVSGSEFNRCISDEETEKALFDNIAVVGKGLDIAGIPAFFVNGEPVKGNKFSKLEPVIKKALADK